MSNVISLEDRRKQKELQETEERTALVREKVGKISKAMRELSKQETNWEENQARLKKERAEANEKVKQQYRLKK